MNSVFVFIAQLLAPLYLVVALLLLFRGKLFNTIMADFKKSPALTYFAGILTLVAGMLWVLSISSCANYTECIFTILGIMVLLKGILLVLFPEMIFKMTYKSPVLKIIGGIVAAIIGIWFLSLGYGLF